MLAAPASVSRGLGFGGFEGREEYAISKEGSEPPGKEEASDSEEEDFAAFDWNGQKLPEI